MLELCKWGSNECERLENVDCFEYLGTQVSADGGCKRDVLSRMNEGYEARGAEKCLINRRGLGINLRSVNIKE